MSKRVGLYKGESIEIAPDPQDRGWRARLSTYDGPESPIGWGNTPEEALESLRVWIGYEDAQ